MIFLTAYMNAELNCWESDLRRQRLTIIDEVLFRMPVDLELQFPAMAVLQSFVNGYDEKMHANNPVKDGSVTFELRYDVEMPDEDLLVTEQELVQDP